MKIKLRVLIAAVLVLSMLTPIAAFGATSSVSISGTGSAKVGDTVTVTVTYKGNSLGYVNGQLTYDNSKLEYLSGGSSQGDAGLVELKSYADDASGKLSFKVKFKAVGAGSVKLGLETLESQNIDGDQDMGTPSSTRTVKIAKAQTPETEAVEESSTEETSEEEETVQETATSIQEESSTTDTEESQPQDQSQSSVSLPLLVGIAAVILVLIIVVAIVLQKRKKK